ncbi:MAG: hypothetical protein ACOYIG_13120 [Acetivibrionales bacterium]
MATPEGEHLFDTYPLLRYYLGTDDAYGQDFALPLWQQQNALLEANRCRLPKVRRFLGSALHDSPVTEIAWTGDSLTIAVDEIQCIDFWSAIKELRKPRGQWPDFRASLVFHNVTHARLYLINRDGEIELVDKNEWLTEIDEFLYDHVVELSPAGIKVALVFFANKRNRYLVLEIAAERLEIVENQRQLIARRLGEDYLPVFDAFVERLEAGEYFGDADMIMNFIKPHLPSSA